MKITIQFFEPFRMLPWIPSSKRNTRNDQFMRGQSFARWHWERDKKTGSPYITGTLLRSHMIRAAEILLYLSNGNIDDTPCCPGEFSTFDKQKKSNMFNLRQRSTLKWTDSNLCTQDHPCPLCEIMGRFDKKNMSAKQLDDFHVRFNNLNPVQPLFCSDPTDIAIERTLNRVDYASGKAHDFFKIWEVDHLAVNTFSGEVVIHQNVSQPARQLLINSLKFIDTICGSLCVVKIDETVSAVEQRFNKMTESTQTKVNEAIDEIVSIFKNHSELEHLRLLADGIRELGRNRHLVDKLPLKHDGTTKHYIWDLENNKISAKSIRSLFEEYKLSIEDKQWRHFCHHIGEGLYIAVKKMNAGLSYSQRILGEDAYHGKSDRNIEQTNFGSIPTNEILVCGELISETPFYFGFEDDSSYQTDLQVLLDRHHQYRLPRSAIRGVFRRDLRTAIGTGCNVEPGGRPCLCPVCRIMRNCRFMDARSSYQEPPEIRQRIRLNPYTGSVAEGALFDMALGPSGLSFPFIFRFRTDKMELGKAINKILLDWMDGKAFLSGAASTGKGRFRLQNLGIQTFDLKNNLADYLSSYGYRGLETRQDHKPLIIEKKECLNQWEKVSVQLKLDSPFLNGDPVRTLIEGNGADIVSFMTLDSAKTGEKVYAYKSESFRGLIRTSLGRKFTGKDPVTGKKSALIAMNHQDCNCLLCRIFGNEHEAGNIRFEDLRLISEPHIKLFDHVAIDRFTGGAVNQKKFDDCSLFGTETEPLVFKGCFWIHADITNIDLSHLANAFADIASGLYALGAKGSIGYGNVKELTLNSTGENSKKLMQSYNDTINDSHSLLSCTKKDTDVSVEFKENKLYWPNYYLKPHEYIHRETVPPGHDRIDSNLLTGKIVCKLKLLTPLIIPDTENDNYFEMANETDMASGSTYHKSYCFFKMNDTLMIPGSEIRGMISAVYEALTNSCFRIFDESYRLSWRMEALPEVLETFKPGRIAKGENSLMVTEMDEVRYPFYDKDCPDETSRNQHFTCSETGKKFQPTHNDKMMTSLAQYNRDNKQPGKKAKYKIIKPKPDSNADFTFTATLDSNTMGYEPDCLVRRSVVGYLKINGPNKIEKENIDTPGMEKIPDPGTQIVHNRTCLRDVTVSNSKRNKNRKQITSEYVCSENGVTYVLNKRCERVFLEKNGKTLPISEKALDMFKFLVEEYHKYAEQQQTPEIFRTILPKNGQLEAGDLIYFRESNNQAVEMIPVKISRKVDSKFTYLGKRLPFGFRPCHGEWLDDQDLNQLNNSFEKKLFTRNKEGLCPACQLFGTGAYKGRVRFGFASLVGSPEWLIKNDSGKLTLPLLERPRPTWPIYREREENKQKDGVKVPGRKFYIHHHNWKKIQNGKNPSTNERIEVTPNNRTVQPLDSGNAFTFDVHFENLRPHELGLLLYSLQLENGLAHKLGMAKSMGFGSVSIDIETIDLRIGSGTPDEWIDQGLQTINEWAEKKENNNINLDTLKKLLYFPKNADPKVCYPTLKQDDHPQKNQPGYEELKEQFKHGYKDRKKLLTTPWMPWH